MAECKKYREMISCYADGELSEKDKKELQSHLEECASCRSLLSLYMSITDAAAESLVEPPDNFAAGVMSKIKMLPESDQQKKSTLNRPTKSIKPVIISFVAAAACLALAFIVSPQLFGFGNSTGMVPMASEQFSYDAASNEAAPNGDTIQAQMKTPESPEASDSVSADGNKAGAAEGGTSALPQTMDITLASEPPQPAPAQAPELTASGRDDTERLKEYYAVFEIKGTLADILKDLPKTNNNDGTFNIEITTEIADQLLKDGFTAEMGAPEASKALVKYTPAS